MSVLSGTIRHICIFHPYVYNPTKVDQLFENKNEDKQIIERYLDTLLSLTMHGIADKLFIKLLDYYKNIDADGAEFYWNEYDKEEE